METIWINIIIMETSLSGNLLVNKILIGLVKKIATFNDCFYKNKIKLDWLLDLEDLFDYVNTLDERKVTLALYKLSGYALSWWEYI